jgi:hypothetical protein
MWYGGEISPFSFPIIELKWFSFVPCYVSRLKTQKICTGCFKRFGPDMSVQHGQGLQGWRYCKLGPKAASENEFWGRNHQITIRK